MTSEHRDSSVDAVVLDWESAPDSFREHAKNLGNELKDSKTQSEQMAQELIGYKRRDAFEAARTEAGVEGVALEDVGDLPPEQITAALVKAKAEERQTQQLSQMEQLAKSQGFENVEEYQTALADAKKIAEQRRAAQSQQAGIATSGEPAQSVEGDPKEKAWKAYQEAVKNRVPPDQARAEYMRALREETSAEQLPAAPTV